MQLPQLSRVPAPASDHNTSGAAFLHPRGHDAPQHRARLPGGLAHHHKGVLTGIVDVVLRGGYIGFEDMLVELWLVGGVGVFGDEEDGRGWGGDFGEERDAVGRYAYGREVACGVGRLVVRLLVVCLEDCWGWWGAVDVEALEGLGRGDGHT